MVLNGPLTSLKHPSEGYNAVYIIYIYIYINIFSFVKMCKTKQLYTYICMSFLYTYIVYYLKKWRKTPTSKVRRVRVLLHFSYLIVLILTISYSDFLYLILSYSHSLTLVSCILSYFWGGSLMGGTLSPPPDWPKSCFKLLLPYLLYYTECLSGPIWRYLELSELSGAI